MTIPKRERKKLVDRKIIKSNIDDQDNDDDDDEDDNYGVYLLYCTCLIILIRRDCTLPCTIF